MRKLSAHEVRKVAVEAEADPRTVASMLKGGSVRPMIADRIKGALVRLGYDAAPQPADVETPQPEAKR